MRTFNYTMSEEQARRIHELAKGSMSAHKNWIASQVESGNLERAKELVSELRALEALFAAFNVDAKIEVAQNAGREVNTSIEVLDRRM